MRLNFVIVSDLEHGDMSRRDSDIRRFLSLKKMSLQKYLTSPFAINIILRLIQRSLCDPRELNSS